MGKSSFINRLLGQNRVIVSDVAGTTRDAIDTNVMWNGREYTFIDTAGLRRKNKIKEELERYSIIRTVSAVERADVVIVVIDAVEGITEQDAKINRYTYRELPTREERESSSRSTNGTRWRKPTKPSTNTRERSGRFCPICPMLKFCLFQP